VACRFGGDEFMLLLADVSVTDGPEAPDEVEATIRRLRAVAEEPYVLNGIEVYTSISVGVAVSPRDADNERGLLAKADVAMYRNKASTRRRAIIAVDVKDRATIVGGGGEVIETGQALVTAARSDPPRSLE
jgi:diguanylate cyclase (GGDEF)-like protein